MTAIVRILREPLVSFALVAALLFALDRGLGAPRTVAPERIDVTSDMRAELVRRFHERSGRAPSADEERALIDEYVRDEIMVREALVLGLDRGDPVIRRRLIQRLEFLAEDLASVAEPDDAALRDYRDRHQARYREPARLTLEHVFVRRGPDAAERAQALSSQLAAGVDAATLGDAFVHGARLRHKSETQLAALMGPGFAAAVMAAPVAEWHGPIESSYGTHLVRVSERRAERLPELDEIRERVRHDWASDARAVAARRWLDDLRARYRVVEAGAP